MDITKYEKDGEIIIEDFLIDLLNNKASKFKVFKLLAGFMINLSLIPHSNTFVERMFNHVNLIKDEIRNLLDVATVSSLVKVKSYHLDDIELFEPTEEYYHLHKQYIKS